MRRRRAARHIALSAALALGAAAPAEALSPRATKVKLAKEMRRAGPTAGALVVDVGSGRTVFSARRASSRMPASVEKLYTTTSALLRFGEEARLRTEVAAVRPLRLDGTLPGDLYLRGGGDPTLTSAGLQALADDLVARTGLSRVTGRVHGDERAFDQLRGVPSAGYGISYDVGAQLGALMVDRGRTGKASPYYQRRPAAWAATRFARALRRAGVRVRGAGREAATPPGALVLAARESPTMGQLAALANVPSDNYVAEMLLKVVGASRGEQGTTARGAALAESTLEAELGVRPTMVDGSGLSRFDRTSPRQVVRLLRLMLHRAEGDALYDSLAVAGRSGTLRDRMRSGAARSRCRGKTGTLRDVSNLAGYCTTRDGATVAFAVLMNGVYPPSARAIQDRMVRAIAKYRPPSAG